MEALTESWGFEQNVWHFAMHVSLISDNSTRNSTKEIDEKLIVFILHLNGPEIQGLDEI